MHFQSKYASDVIQKAHLSVHQTIETLLELNVRYFSLDGTLLSDPSIYCTIFGSMVYLIVTNPDISYVVNVVSQFVVSPTTVH